MSLFDPFIWTDLQIIYFFLNAASFRFRSPKLVWCALLLPIPILTTHSLKKTEVCESLRALHSCFKGFKKIHLEFYVIFGPLYGLWTMDIKKSNWRNVIMNHMILFFRPWFLESEQCFWSIFWMLKKIVNETKGKGPEIVFPQFWMKQGSFSSIVEI